MQVAPSEPYGQSEFDDSVSTYLVILLIEDDEMRELFGLGVVYGFEKGGYVLPFCEEVEVGEGTGVLIRVFVVGRTKCWQWSS